MKILGIIYLTISVITFLYIIFFGIVVKQKMRRENPDIRFRKVTLAERLFSFLTLLIISFCPIFNLISLLTVELATEQIEEMIIDKLYEMTE
jgi:hypothetical protein